MWVDNWSPDKVSDAPPPGARGVLCLRHSEALSAPRGWVMEDRRESIPRLFKPRDRGNLSAVPEPTAETPRPKADSTGSIKRDVPGAMKRDVTGATKRPRPADIPRPSLFAELEESVVEEVAVAEIEVVVNEPVIETVPVFVEELVAQEPVVEELVIEELVVEEPIVEEPVVEVHVVEEEVVEIPPTQDDSTELLIRQDVDTRWAPHFDPDDDLGGMLDATGSMLRDAFRARHNGRRDQ
jgi:hypothetical protein